MMLMKIMMLTIIEQITTRQQEVNLLSITKIIGSASNYNNTLDTEVLFH